MVIDDIALTMEPSVGPKTANHLLSIFGSAEAVFSASVDELIERAELREELARRIVQKTSYKQAEAEMKYCQKHEIIPIPSHSDDYPPMLKECGDHPHVIYFKGDPTALSRRTLSVVGTRKISTYGQRVCEQVVGSLARMFPDLVIVSGLAYGVDSAAHRSALTNGLATVGVLANPLPQITPAPHTTLAKQMIESGGGVLTEYSSQSKMKGVTFIPRNRIIAGMSLGTLVVESDYGGGSLTTASMADGYQRSVMAIPGRIGESSSAGCNFMIKSNRAVMICSANDIAREMTWEIPEGAGQGRSYATSMASDGALKLLELIEQGEQISIDELISNSGLSIAEIAPLILELEMDGAIRVSPGKMYERR